MQKNGGESSRTVLSKAAGKLRNSEIDTALLRRADASIEGREKEPHISTQQE
jgi:hypothetical protein